jgi:hypothetical protein
MLALDAPIAQQNSARLKHEAVLPVRISAATIVLLAALVHRRVKGL